MPVVILTEPMFALGFEEGTEPSMFEGPLSDLTGETLVACRRISEPLPRGGNGDKADGRPIGVA